MSIERAAIASLLNGGWNFGGHILAESDFLDQRNRRIFRTIRDLARQGADVDLFMVGDKLGEPLVDFAQEFASAKSIRTYADQLKDASLKRELWQAAQDMLTTDGTGREQLLAAQSLLASLHSGVSGEVVPVGERVAAWWQELSDRASGKAGLKTGFADIDRRLGGLRGGDLIVLAGRPSMGKTALAMNIAQQCGAATAFFSLEMQAGQLLDRLAASVSGVSFSHIHDPQQMTDDEWRKVTAASATIKTLPLFVDDTGGLAMEEIHARARSLKAKSGLSLVIVDYLQLVTGDPHLSREQQVSMISRDGKRMAKDLDVPVILLAQLSRKPEDRESKRPLMSDLRDSGAIEQDADAVGFIYRDEQYNPDSPHKGYAEVIWRKVRQGEPGTDWFVFHGAQQKFLPAVRPEPIAAPVRKKPYQVAAGGHWSD